MNEIIERSAVSSTLKTERTSSRLEGNLSTLDIVFTVLAYNAPLTVVTGSLPLIVSLGNGLGVPVTFLIAGALMILFSVGFTTMSKYSSNPGAFYAYITAGLGRPLGLGSAFTAIVAYIFLMVAIVLYGGVVYVSLFKNFFGESPLNWWQWATVLLAIVAVLGYLRITLSAKVLSIALVLEVLVVFAWEAVIVSHQGAAVFAPGWLTLEAVGSGSFGLAILFGVSGFAGFEATAVFREEAKNPDITVPRATYISVIAMTAIFASAGYFFICGFGPNEALAKAATDPSNAALDSISRYLGRVGLDTVNVLLCSSVFACMLALQNILSRYIYSLSVDGTLPKMFSAIHEKHGSPHCASVATTVIMFVSLAVTIYYSVEPYAGYGMLLGVGGYALLLLQILTSASVIGFFYKRADKPGLLKTFVAPLLSSLALGYTAVLATQYLDVLTGNARVATVLLSILFSLMIAGIIYALVLRRTKPGTYQAIGRQKV